MKKNSIPSRWSLLAYPVEFGSNEVCAKNQRYMRMKGCHIGSVFSNSIKEGYDQDFVFTQTGGTYFIS